MKIRTLRIALLSFLTCNVPSAISQQEMSHSIERAMTPTQIEQFRNVEIFNQPRELGDGQLVVPRYRMSGGELVITGEKFTVDSQPSINIGVPSQIKWPSIDPSNGGSIGEDLYLEFRSHSDLENLDDLEEIMVEGEISTYLGNISTDPTIESVAPGEIFGGNGGTAWGNTSDIPPDILNTIPEDLVDDVIEWSNDECNAARNEFLDGIEKPLYDLFEEILDGDLSGVFGDVDKRVQLAELSREYDSKCLKPVEMAIKDGSFPQSIIPRVVFITLNEVPICGGVRLNKTTVLTARHCFYDPKSGKVKDFAKDLDLKIASNTFGVYVLDQLNAKHSINPDKGIISLGGSFNISRDFIRFNILENAGSPLSNPSVHGVLSTDDPIEIFKEVNLVGYFGMHNPERLLKLPGAIFEDWRNGLRVTNGSYCRIFDKSVNDKCLSHACQSIMLFSGGGLLSASESSEESKVNLHGITTNAGEGSTEQCGDYVKQREAGVPFIGNQGGIAITAQWIFNR